MNTKVESTNMKLRKKIMLTSADTSLLGVRKHIYCSSNMFMGETTNNSNAEFVARRHYALYCAAIATPPAGEAPVR